SHSYARSASVNREPRSRAIAASTRFHGSVLPPGTHGMFPVGICTEAIASMVWAMSARVTTPGTSGSSCSVKGFLPPLRAGRRRLLAVQDDTLSEHRVQCSFGNPRPPWVVLDQRTQELVVALHGHGFGVVEAVRALEPPVGRVERVRVMRAALEE